MRSFRAQRRELRAARKAFAASEARYQELSDSSTAALERAETELRGARKRETSARAVQGRALAGEERARAGEKRARERETSAGQRFEVLDRATLELGLALARARVPDEHELLRVVADQARRMIDVDLCAVTDSSGRQAVSCIGRRAAQAIALPGGRSEMRDGLTVQIRFGGRTTGEIHVQQEHRSAGITTHQRWLVEKFSERVGVLMEIARLGRVVVAAVNARDSVLAMVAHDLRNPLAAIRLNAGAMIPKGGKVDRRRSRRQAGLIIRSTENMNPPDRRSAPGRRRRLEHLRRGDGSRAVVVTGE